MARGSSGLGVDGSQFARPLEVPALEGRIKKSVESKVRRQLGIDGAMPPDLKTAVEQAAKLATQRAIEVTVGKLAEDASQETGRAGLIDRFGDKLKFAADGIKLIDESADVSTVLARRANLLAKKRQALVDAGFSSDEAFQVLLADLQARG